MRGAPGVRTTFAAIHGVQGRQLGEQLVVSYDQLKMSPNTPATNPANGDSWFHTDQAPFYRPAAGKVQGSFGLERDYVQGFVSLQATAPHLHNNVVIPKSHLQFQDWAPDFFDPEMTSKRGLRYDLIRVSDLPSGCAGITAHMEAGDMFLWDSRTLHGACKGVAGAPLLPPLPQSGEQQSSSSSVRLGRAVVYVCYSPKDKLTAEVAAQRRYALAAGIGFGHQAHHLDAKVVVTTEAAADDGGEGGGGEGAGACGLQLRFEDLSDECKALVA